MKNIKYFILIIAFIFTFANEGFSQFRKGSYVSSLEYSAAINVGRSSDFLSNPGLLGGFLTMKTFFQKNLAAGLTVGYNQVGKKDENMLTELPNGAVFGPQSRHFNYLPAYANLSYYFVKNRRSKFMPYIQANVGMMRIWQRLQLGVAVFDNDNWHFAAGPEIGFMVNLGQSVGLVLNGKYNYAFSAGTTLAGKDGNSFSFINVNLGLSYIR